jgi:hypothetical protein
MSEPSSLIHVTRGLARRRRKIGRSMQSIARIESSNPPNKKKRDISDVLLMLRSGVRNITGQGMIWRSEELFWITRRCQRSQQHRNHSEETIVGPIPIILISLTRST